MVSGCIHRRPSQLQVSGCGANESGRPSLATCHGWLRQALFFARLADVFNPKTCLNKNSSRVQYAYRSSTYTRIPQHSWKLILNTKLGATLIPTSMLDFAFVSVRSKDEFRSRHGQCERTNMSLRDHRCLSHKLHSCCYHWHHRSVSEDCFAIDSRHWMIAWWVLGTGCCPRLFQPAKSIDKGMRDSRSLRNISINQPCMLYKSMMVALNMLK